MNNYHVVLLSASLGIVFLRFRIGINHTVLFIDALTIVELLSDDQREYDSCFSDVIVEEIVLC